MSTKVIIIGEVSKPKLKPIEFKYQLNTFDTIVRASITPKGFNFIELVCKDYSGGYDLMFAYNSENKRNSGCLFIGHFNDGVVE